MVGHYCTFADVVCSPWDISSHLLLFRPVSSACRSLWDIALILPLFRPAVCPEWEEFRSTSGQRGGTPAMGVASLEACKRLCTHQRGCTAVDYSRHVVRTPCSLHYADEPDTMKSNAFVDQYRLAKHCANAGRVSQ